MDCSRVEESLSLYVSGELDSTGRKRLLEHVETCPDCRRALEQERELASLLKRVPRRKCPAHVVEAILEKTARAEEAHRWRLLPRRLSRKEIGYAFATVAIAIAAVVFGTLFRQGPRVAGGPAETYSAEQIEQAQKGTEMAISLLMYVAERSGRDLSNRDIIGLVTKPIEDGLRQALDIPKEEKSHEKT